jgi:hypothetical protein
MRMSHAAPIDAQPAGDSRQRRVARLYSPAAAWVVLGVLLVVTGALLLYETRGTTLYRAEWIWALGRRGNDPGTFLRSHFGHFSLVPIAIYRVLFATVGIDHSAPYRALAIGAHLACVVLLFSYAIRRVGSFLALLAAALLLFLGPASQNILWPFQMAWLISLGTGIGALLLLDRGDRVGNAGACGLLGVSLASSGVGLPIALGLIVEVMWRRPRHAWIVAVPVALYALWWLIYQTSETGHWGEDIPLTPAFVVNAPAAVLSALAGLAGPTNIDGPQTPLTWGTPLLIVAVGALALRLSHLWPPSPRIAALATMALAFWIGTALDRAFFGGPYAGRYIYVGAILMLLLVAELARGVSVGLRAGALLAAAVAAAAVSNVGAFRDAARDLRARTLLIRAEVGTLDITRHIVKPGYVSEGFLFDEVVAGPYLSAEKALGTPAASPAEIAAMPADVRKAADSQLIRIHEVSLRGSTAGLRPGARPAVEGVVGGVVTGRGACVTFRPAGVTPPGATSELRVAVPRTGLLVTSEGSPAAVGLRRFAEEFQPLGSVASGASAVLRIGPDLATQPWHLRVAPTDRAMVCGLA